MHPPMTAPALPRLLAFDLDGTLLPADKQITRHTRAVLERIRELGTQITLATGKFHHLTVGHGDELDLDTPLISLDGACIGNRDHPERKRGIPAEVTRDALGRYQGLCQHAFADDGEDRMLLRSTDGDHFRHVTRFWADDFRHVDDLAEAVRADSAIVTFYGDEEPMREIADDIRGQHPRLRVTEYASNLVASYRVSIQPDSTHKGSGVLDAAEMLGIDASEVMVFGDWLNDLPMFGVGAIGVAMSNAMPEVLKVADYVTDRTCEEDGIADFLERNYL